MGIVDDMEELYKEGHYLKVCLLARDTLDKRGRDILSSLRWRRWAKVNYAPKGWMRKEDAKASIRLMRILSRKKV